jgi:hypothetical protein
MVKVSSVVFPFLFGFVILKESLGFSAVERDFLRFNDGAEDVFVAILFFLNSDVIFGPCYASAL